MIDYFFKFTNVAAAKADPVVQQNMDTLRTIWRNDYVLVDLQVWRPSQDVAGPNDSFGNPTVIHTFLTGWFVMVSLPNQVPVLLNHSALQFALDRDGPPYVIKNNIGAVMQDVRVSPIFMGSHYPTSLT